MSHFSENTITGYGVYANLSYHIGFRIALEYRSQNLIDQWDCLNSFLAWNLDIFVTLGHMFRNPGTTFQILPNIFSVWNPIIFITLYKKMM